MKKIFGLCFAFALMSLSANSTIIDIDYEWDGTTFTSLNGNNLFGTNLAVGDTLNLSFTGVNGNNWDFTGLGSTGNVNLGFDIASSCGSKSSSGSYEAMFGGSSLLSSSYSVPSQGCIHLGPNNIDFSGINLIDRFSISFTLNSSGTPDNIIGSYADNTWWQIWELFGMTEDNIVVNAVDVPTPASLSLFLLGLIALVRQRKS